MEHAKLQPSSGNRWMQCAASVALEAIFPDADDESAREGTLAHSVASVYLRANKHPPSHPDITEEMLDGAEMLYDDVMAVRAQMNSCATFRIEEKVDCSSIHPECWGTPDVRLLDVAKNRLYVWDYKFGHRYVDPFQNFQLIAYALGCLQNYGTATTGDLQVHLRIVQPRSYHPSGPIREWVVSAKELLEQFLPLMQFQASLAMAEGAEAAVGYECRDCKARHQCATLQEAAYSVVHIARKGTLHGLSPDALGRELATFTDAMEILKSRVSGLENEVLATIKSGGAVRGWMTAPGQGRQKWNKPLEEVLALGEMMAINLSKAAAVTPKQAIKAGIPEAVVAGYSEVPIGEIKLVRDTGAQARKVFSGG